ncbi:MAG TPA: flagellar basal-body rod protein FlgF [Porticoccaceae bacterium]|nr:flagellar basal-body rod protein FlgF [Porticoccaceae bacterium]
MDRLLYIAMSGANAAMTAQAVNAHNLANASTTGFKADMAMFGKAQVVGPGHSSRTFVQLEGTRADMVAGTTQTTGRELDVSVNGRGWIAVQAPDGGEAYTRRGDLRLDEFGLLTNGAGMPVLGNAGPIAVPPNAKLEIGGDGTISVLPIGQNPNTLAVVDRIKLVTLDEANLAKDADGMLRTADGEPTPPDASVRVVSGSLETSNVNAIESMVRMIELARSFEAQVKMMKTAEENDRNSSQIMRMS